MPKTFVIILNWNSLADTAECLTSLRASAFPDSSIALVDNASTDGSGQLLKEQFPEIILLRNNENLGFAEGNNVGIRQALISGVDYVMLLNNDTVAEPSCVSILVKRLEADSAVGIVGPKIYFSGTNVIWFAGGMLNRLTGFTYHLGERRVDQGQFNQPRQIDFVSGCAMLVRREVFEKIGFLDPDYHHSHEDADFCLKAKKAGFKVVYEPRSVIHHKLARSSGGRKSPFYLYYRTRNHLVFKKKQNIKAAFFWPVFSLLVIKRTFGSLLLGRPKGTWATLTGIYDYYAGNWGRGSGDKFR